MCQNGLLFEAEYYCIVWLGLVFFLHSPVSRHLGGFPLMATGNSAAVNRSVPVGLGTSSLELEDMLPRWSEEDVLEEEPGA